MEKNFFLSKNLFLALKSEIADKKTPFFLMIKSSFFFFFFFQKLKPFKKTWFFFLKIRGDSLQFSTDQSRNNFEQMMGLVYFCGSQRYFKKGIVPTLGPLLSRKFIVENYK